MTPYADARPVHDIKNCFFYHRMDLPGIGVVGGQWDLRSTIEDYLAGFQFAGKRVLDVGAASGFRASGWDGGGAGAAPLAWRRVGGWVFWRWRVWAGIRAGHSR